jgi:chromosome segregation ATPase
MGFLLPYLLGGALLLGGAGVWWGHSNGYDEGRSSRDLEVQELKAQATQATAGLQTCSATNKDLQSKLPGLEGRIKEAEDKCSTLQSRTASLTLEQQATVNLYKKRAELAEAKEAELRRKGQPASQQCKDVLAAVRNVAEAASDRIRDVLGFTEPTTGTGRGTGQLKVQ